MYTQHSKGYNKIQESKDQLLGKSLFLTSNEVSEKKISPMKDPKNKIRVCLNNQEQ